MSVTSGKLLSFALEHSISNKVRLCNDTTIEEIEKTFLQLMADFIPSLRLKFFSTLIECLSCLPYSDNKKSYWRLPNRIQGLSSCRGLSVIWRSNCGCRRSHWRDRYRSSWDDHHERAWAHRLYSADQSQGGLFAQTLRVRHRYDR